jgi:hypothetical protein
VTGTSEAGVTGAAAAAAAAGATGATEVVAAGCAHCIGVAVAGLAAALVAAEGLEGGASGDVGSGESRVPERGFLPRLAADDGAGRCFPLVDVELDGFAGMKVRSWKGLGEAMMGVSGNREFPSLDKWTRLVFESVDRPWLAVYLQFHLNQALSPLLSQTTLHLRTPLRLPSSTSTTPPRTLLLRVPVLQQGQDNQSMPVRHSTSSPVNGKTAASPSTT